MRNRLSASAAGGPLIAFEAEGLGGGAPAAAPDAGPDAAPATPDAAPVTPEAPAPLLGQPPADDAKPKADAEAEKPDAEKPEDGKDGKEEPAAAEFTDFTLPEGMELDTATLDAFKPLAKEFGLTQEQAQKLVDVYAGKQAAAAEAQAQAWRDAQAEWVEQAKADKEIGGAKFDQNVGVAKKALDRFSTPELLDALTLTGAGNHPEFVRFCHRVGKAISEDGIVTPGLQPGTPEVSTEQYMAEVFAPKKA